MAELCTIIRPATHKDLDILVHLLETLFGIEADFHFNAERQRNGLQHMLDGSSTRIVFVAEVDGNVVGMCAAQEVLSTAEGREAAWIEDVVVFPAFRRRGIARALLEAIEDWAATRGIRRLQLLADRENAPALQFYTREEWQPTQLICLRKRLNTGGVDDRDS